MFENVPWFGPDWEIPHWVWRAVPLATECQEELPQCYVPQLAARFQCGTDDVCHYHSESNFCYATSQSMRLWKAETSMKTSMIVDFYCRCFLISHCFLQDIIFTFMIIVLLLILYSRNHHFHPLQSTPISPSHLLNKTTTVFPLPDNPVVEGAWRTRMFSAAGGLSLSWFGPQRHKQLLPNQVRWIISVESQSLYILETDSYMIFIYIFSLYYICCLLSLLELRPRWLSCTPPLPWSTIILTKVSWFSTPAATKS